MTMKPKFRRLKYACYTTNISMSVVSNLSPVLFLTFHSLYGISYSLLGLLVLINFFTQLCIDLIFSFFSHRFNIPKVVKCIPILTAVGLFLYSAIPFMFPQKAYLGLAVGTLVFSASGGLSEVLISPVIAAIPSPDPEKEMSRLHSIYAWGVVFVIVFASLFLFIFGNENWYFLSIALMLIPVISAFLYFGTEIPEMGTPERTSGVIAFLKKPTLWLCFFSIFLGGAAECIMAQWSSGYLEKALGIPKLYGDIFGVAFFSVALGTGRTLYARFGKDPERIIFLGAVGATFCYIAAAICNIPIIGLVTCALTGFCVSMLWPGNLIVAAKRFPEGGVFIFAMMAAGGDLGASIGPQLVGIITDLAVNIPALSSLGESMGIAPDRLGLKLGMLFAVLFPLCALPLYSRLAKKSKQKLD
ncbi:MAG: MFS transporter [Ruminococcaceae bacterium]|nr:MFS transporter [Oscillospiraceae bacterium]